MGGSRRVMYLVMYAQLGPWSWRRARAHTRRDVANSDLSPAVRILCITSATGSDRDCGDSTNPHYNTECVFHSTHPNIIGQVLVKKNPQKTLPRRRL